MSHAASSIVQTGSAISVRNGSVSDDAHGCSTPKANGFGAAEGGYEANGSAPITAFTSTNSDRVARIASGSRCTEELDQALLTWTSTCAIRSDPRYRPRMTEPATRFHKASPTQSRGTIASAPLSVPLPKSSKASHMVLRKPATGTSLGDGVSRLTRRSTWPHPRSTSAPEL